ncbi:Phosphoesterase family protein [hydrothermal vent metagenome]|uniref:Phosphoesterase family protein n=1 Tax=hydrothermal vent metagenome TaxID=652676 RepID=A0A1W1EEM2_9ZZZZ
MKIAFIGDIVGKPGRLILKKHLKRLQEEHFIDFTIANYENASHGFGLTEKNCIELLGYGINMMTGGNHSFDKKEILDIFDKYPLIRPINYPKETAGEGLFKTMVLGHEIAIVNLMGYYTMPMVDNPFTMIKEVVDRLKHDGIKHIIIDMHAEASSEKQALFQMLKKDVSAIIGTHTHVSTDDLQVDNGCCFLTDIGLTGCRDGVIGISSEIPIKRLLTGLGGHFNVADKCKAILQMLVFELDDNGECIAAEKIKIYDDKPKIVTKAYME